MRAIFKIRFEHIKGCIALIPTVVCQTKRYAYHGDCVIEIAWLTFRICLGKYADDI